MIEGITKKSPADQQLYNKEDAGGMVMVMVMAMVMMMVMVMVMVMVGRILAVILNMMTMMSNTIIMKCPTSVTMRSNKL